MANAPWGPSTPYKPPKKRKPAFWAGVGRAAGGLLPKAPAGGWAGAFVPGFMGPSNQAGGNPYAGLIGGMPDLSALKAQYAAQSRDDAASRDAALRRLIVSYGGMPDLSGVSISKNAQNFLSKAFDPKTRELAAKADAEGLSIRARQQAEQNIANRRIPASLAGRGLLRSGQTGYDLGQQAQAFKTQQYDTLNELLGNVEGTVGNFLQAERQRQLALAEAEMQAAWAAQNQWGDYPIGPDYGASYAGGGGAGRPNPAAAYNILRGAQTTRKKKSSSSNPYAYRGVYGSGGSV